MAGRKWEFMGRMFRLPCLTHQLTHEALAIRVKRRLNSTDVLEAPADVMILRGPQANSRSDNGYCETFNCKLPGKLLNREIFFSLTEAEVVIEAW